MFEKEMKKKVVEFAREKLGRDVSLYILSLGTALGRTYYWVGVIDIDNVVIVDDRVFHSYEDIKEVRYVVVEKSGAVRWANELEKELLSGAKNIEFVGDKEFMESFFEKFREKLNEKKNIWRALEELSDELNVLVVFEIWSVKESKVKAYLSFIKGKRGLLIMPLLRDLRQPSLEIEIEVEARIDVESGKIDVRIYVSRTFFFTE